MLKITLYFVIFYIICPLFSYNFIYCRILYNNLE
nr:MAG TPA: hypothetical protein [Caudoviricetes sp.]